jgi:hypothetical protein
VPAAVSSLMEGLQDVEQIDYKLGMQALKLRWEVSVCGCPGGGGGQWLTVQQWYGRLLCLPGSEVGVADI